MEKPEITISQKKYDVFKSCMVNSMSYILCSEDDDSYCRQCRSSYENSVCFVDILEIFGKDVLDFWDFEVIVYNLIEHNNWEILEKFLSCGFRDKWIPESFDFSKCDDMWNWGEEKIKSVIPDIIAHNGYKSEIIYLDGVDLEANKKKISYGLIHKTELKEIVSFIEEYDDILNKWIIQCYYENAKKKELDPSFKILLTKIMDEWDLEKVSEYLTILRPLINKYPSVLLDLIRDLKRLASDEDNESLYQEYDEVLTFCKKKIISNNKMLKAYKFDNIIIKTV